MVAPAGRADLAGDRDVQAVARGIGAAGNAGVAVIVVGQGPVRVGAILGLPGPQTGMAVPVSADAPDESEHASRTGQEAKKQGAQEREVKRAAYEHGCLLFC
jgi:hypothetical protein